MRNGEPCTMRRYVGDVKLLARPGNFAGMHIGCKLFFLNFLSNAHNFVCRKTADEIAVINSHNADIIFEQRRYYYGIKRRAFNK